MDYLDQIDAVAQERYDGISTTDLLVYVAYQMQQHGVKLTFEPIVVAAHRFFPGAFSLVGFPQYPDASRIGRTLLQCRPKYRGLITGSASSQFVITELGEERAREVALRIDRGYAGMIRVRRNSRPRAVVDRMEQEVRSSSAFAAWRATEPVSEYDFYHFLHLLPGASQASVRENFRAISDAAKGSEDNDVKAFLVALQSQYSKELKS